MITLLTSIQLVRGSNIFRDTDYRDCLSRFSSVLIHTGIEILNLVVCILLRVLDQVQGFPSNATLFQ
jgi:hypothetical protein